MAYNFAASDPASVLREIARLTGRQRDLNLQDNPAFDTGSPIAEAYGMETAGHPGTAPLVPGGGSERSARNREVYQNNAQLATLMDLSKGGTGGGWRATAGMAGRDVTPGAGEYGAAQRRSIYAPADDGTSGRTTMATPYGALQSAAGMNPRMENDLLQERLRQEKARSEMMGGATPMGRETAQQNERYDELTGLRTGRTRELALGGQDIKNQMARSEAVSKAETAFEPAVRAQEGIALDERLNQLGAQYGYPARVKAGAQMTSDEIKRLGLLDASKLRALAPMIQEAIRQKAINARTPDMTDEQRTRMAQEAQDLSDLLRSVTGGAVTPAQR